MKAAHEVNNSRLWWMLLTFKVLSSNPNLIHLVVSVKRECWQKLENLALEADDDSSHQQQQLPEGGLPCDQNTYLAPIYDHFSLALFSEYLTHTYDHFFATLLHCYIVIFGLSVLPQKVLSSLNTLIKMGGAEVRAWRAFYKLGLKIYSSKVR